LRRRGKLEEQLEVARDKVTGYEDGELDMPESAYMRYAQRVTLYMKKLEAMHAMDESVRNVDRFLILHTEFHSISISCCNFNLPANRREYGWRIIR
jgi:hypothetical protein